MKKEINWKTVAISLVCLALMALVIFRPSFDARVAVEKKVELPRALRSRR